MNGMKKPFLLLIKCRQLLNIQWKESMDIFFTKCEVKVNKSHMFTYI